MMEPIFLSVHSFYKILIEFVLDLKKVKKIISTLNVQFVLFHFFITSFTKVTKYLQIFNLICFQKVGYFF